MSVCKRTYSSNINVCKREEEINSGQREEIHGAWNFFSDELSEDNINGSDVVQEIDDKRGKLKDNRLEGRGKVC